MELIAEHITINDCKDLSSEKTIKLSPEVLALTKDISKNIELIPAPFYDELHFANYE